MPQRQTILSTYSQWTAHSALRSGAPIKSRNDVNKLIEKIDFDPILDTTRARISQDEFEVWHKSVLDMLVIETTKLNNQYGWAAKIVNVYLKTYCYVGDGGRENIRNCLHPPFATDLWSCVFNRFYGNQSIINDTHKVTSIKAINTHEKYLRIIKGLRAASTKLKCPLIEIEQLWEANGTS